METVQDKYLYETFEAELSDFDTRFSEYLNSKYSSGWKYKSCQFDTAASKRFACCLFKRSKKS